MAYSSFGQGKYMMSLEHTFTLESKELLKNNGNMSKGQRSQFELKLAKTRDNPNIKINDNSSGL